MFNIQVEIHLNLYLYHKYWYLLMETKHPYIKIKSDYCQFRAKYNVSETFSCRLTDRIIYLVSPVKQQIELEWPNINFAQK